MSVEVRNARVEEAPAIQSLLEEHGLAALGESEVSEEEVREWFAVPTIQMQVAERDGRLVGYLDRAAYEASGWKLIRHSFQMRIDLGEDVPEPEWPEGLTVRNFRAGDEERVHAAQMDAFADHWDFRPQSLDNWRGFTVERSNFDPSLWWLVEDGDELAGLSLNQWHFSGDPQFGWIQILCVRPPWRKRGLGTALLRHSFRDFRGRAATRVGLGVDAENSTGAVRLYERAGMRPVRRNDIYEKTL